MMLKSKLVLALAAAAALSTPALAEPAQANRAAPVKASAPAVQVCDGSAITRAAWVREHGPMSFVTAEELARGKVAASGPVCITERQLERLHRMNQRAKLDGERLASR